MGDRRRRIHRPDGAILDRCATQFPWIRVVHRPDRGFRKSGGGVVDAFNSGYQALQCDTWDFIVKLDGDLSFSPDYFQKCFDHFQKRPRLGIGGGETYYEREGGRKLEANPRFHVRGATKIYRRPCWEALGGLWPGGGKSWSAKLTSFIFGPVERSKPSKPLRAL